MSNLKDLTPSHHKSVTASDVNLLPTGTVELFINVTVAGNVRLRMMGPSGDDEDVDYAFAIGTHIVPGRFRMLLSTGTTATATYVARSVVPDRRNP